MTTWGELIELAYGKALGERQDVDGIAQVFGTNGPTGLRSSEAQGLGPTVVIGRKGAYRGVQWAPGPFWVIDTAFYVRPRTALDLGWAFRALSAVDINRLDSGSAIPSTRREDVYRLPVFLPPIKEQRGIAGVLGALDRKIESNWRLAKTLEEIGAALFRARFVDFIDHEDFVESEIGPIPRGWTVRAIGDLLSVVGGSTPSTKNPEFWDGGSHCWATPKDLSGLDMPVLLDTARHITDAGVDRISSRLLPPRTTLMSSRAPVGYTAIALMPVAVNQGFIAIPPSEEFPSEYVLFWLRENMALIKANAGGTTFAEISKRAFRPLPMLVPPSEVLEDFRRAAGPMLDRIAVCSKENVALGALRDALLPRLVSGRIRVGTAPPEESPL